MPSNQGIVEWAVGRGKAKRVRSCQEDTEQSGGEGAQTTGHGIIRMAPNRKARELDCNERVKQIKGQRMAMRVLVVGSGKPEARKATKTT